MKAMTALKTIAASVAAIGLFGAAQAAPIVTDWDYSIVSKWTGYTPAEVTLSPDEKTLSWGDSVSRSSLVLTDPAAGSIQTYLGSGIPSASFTAPGLTMTHNNEVLPADTNSLLTASLSSQLNLTPTLPDPGASFSLAPVLFDILFTETVNAEPCASDSPVPCNDIFVLVSGLLNASFDYMGNNYFVNIFPTVDGILNTLTDAECAAAGAASGCIGVTTVEHQANHLPFGITISTQPLQIPEPGILALLGIGLFGAGLAQRRRKQAN